MSYISVSLTCVGLLAGSRLEAQIFQSYEDGPIHEAFVNRVSANPIMMASRERPPKPLNERIPKQLDMQAEWIPGYWSFDQGKNDFVWTSGIWRRPPPGHQWITGFWKDYEEGWVWISGFWTRTSEQHLEYIGQAPPDPIDENTAPPPNSNYFWNSGYWVYQFDKHTYHWVRGHWEELDPQWILVPSHYVWRPGGYVFVPAFWDWTLEDRGTAFASLTIPPESRKEGSVEPSLILRPKVIIKNLFPYYPDYLSLYQHYTHFHSEFWSDSCCAPPWWDWDTWWCFSWDDQWALWWWYTHPGYPQPIWLTHEIAGILPPPATEQIVMMEDVVPPVFVIPEGVVTSQELLSGIKRTTGRFVPILPPEEKQVLKIYRLANDDRQVIREKLRPIGRRLPINPSAIRPNVRKPIVEMDDSLSILRLSVDQAPRPPFKPKIPSNGRSSVWNAQDRTAPPESPTYTPPIKRPSWSPRSGSEKAEGDKSASAIPGNAGYDDAEGYKRWRLMKPYSDPPMTRSSMHKPDKSS